MCKPVQSSEDVDGVEMTAVVGISYMTQESYQ